MNALIVEDQINMVLTYRIALVNSGHRLTVARNGMEAMQILERERFDVVITDWMMPNKNGVELIGWIRAHIHPAPSMIMVTSLGLPDAVEKAIDAGADEYIVKPIMPDQLLATLDRVKNRQLNQTNISAFGNFRKSSNGRQSVRAVAVAAGSGAIPVLESLLNVTGPIDGAALLVVVHCPAWAHESLFQKLSRKLSKAVEIGKSDTKIAARKIYLAPADYHMVVHPDNMTIQLDSSSPENFVRPAADPLMRSVAAAFTSRSIGIVLGGLGCDGSIGAGFIHTAGGKVLVLNPAEAVVPQMSQRVIEIGMADYVLSSEGIIRKLQELQD